MGDVQFENDWHAPQNLEPRSRMANWVMQKFGVKSTHSANIVLVVFSVCAILLSFYFFFFV